MSIESIITTLVKTLLSGQHYWHEYGHLGIDFEQGTVAHYLSGPPNPKIPAT